MHSFLWPKGCTYEHSKLLTSSFGVVGQANAKMLNTKSWARRARGAPQRPASLRTCPPRGKSTSLQIGLLGGSIEPGFFVGSPRELYERHVLISIIIFDFTLRYDADYETIIDVNTLESV